MRSELSFFTIPVFAEKELFADDSIRARTRDVSEATIPADSLTAVADPALR